MAIFIVRLNYRRCSVSFNVGYRIYRDSAFTFGRLSILNERTNSIHIEHFGDNNDDHPLWFGFNLLLHILCFHL